MYVSPCSSLSRGRLLLVLVTLGYSRVFFVSRSACWPHKGSWITSDGHIHVPVMCQMPHPWIIILPSTDPRVAMATVSVIVSVVLAGCSHGNNVCNRGLVQIKLFRCEMHVWEEPQRMGHTRTHTPTAQTRAFTETERTPSREHMHSHSHGGVDIDRQSAGVIFLPPFPNKCVSTATILIVTWRRRQRKDWQREREARRWKGSPRREYGSRWREEGGVVIYK